VVVRAFPVTYSDDVDRAARFWELFGFERFHELPNPDGTLGYAGLRCGGCELAITHGNWSRDRYGRPPGEGPCFEMYMYVDDLDATVERLRAQDVVVLREPEAMPWGERIASVADPDGNPVTLCAERRAS
jgi:lactoylglutathione lyase